MPTLKLAETNNVIHQGVLENAVRALFPTVNIKTNLKKETLLRNNETDSFLEVDVWIPSLHLFFEFQDSYHYLNTWYSSAAVAQMKLRDDMKREKAMGQGITVIIVPCWWDGKHDRLRETILFQRPDLQLISSNSHPIPLSPTAHFFDNTGIPDVVELMLASFPSSVNFHLSISTSSPWWLGEKYDGVRACWNARKRNLYSRTGLMFIVPQQFISLFPPMFLDSEIWIGRGCFTEVQSSMKSTTENVEWSSLRIVAFDNPKTSSLPFEKRYASLLSLPPSHPFITIAPRVLCTSSKRMKKHMAHIMEDGGEGVILRRPNSLYVQGRSPSLWKLKATREDKEALVLRVTEDDALLQLPDGTEFEVEHQGGLLLQKGDVVTFAYDQYSTQKIPSNASILRVRKDISWDDVLNDHNREIDNIGARKGDGLKPFQYWTADNSKNSRAFLEQFAINNNLDPLLASSWYGAASEFKKLKEASSILAHQNGSFVKTLLHIFPDINFDVSKFAVLTTKYWHDVKNRRKFFDNFARQQGFGPLLPDNWYSVDSHILRNTKGAKSVLNYYNSSIITALIHVYPDVEFKTELFQHLPVGYWYSPHNQRNFFERFARENNFDPLVPENWYFVLKADLLSFGAGPLLASFKGSYVRALVQTFADVKFETSKFADLDGKRRKWFLNFAKKHKIDPLVPTNWYSKRNELLAAKGSMDSVLKYYDGKVRKALLHLFPNIGLQPKKFRF